MNAAAATKYERAPILGYYESLANKRITLKVERLFLFLFEQPATWDDDPSSGNNLRGKEMGRLMQLAVSGSLATRLRMNNKIPHPSYTLSSLNWAWELGWAEKLPSKSCPNHLKSYLLN